MKQAMKGNKKLLLVIILPYFPSIFLLYLWFEKVTDNLLYKIEGAIPYGSDISDFMFYCFPPIFFLMALIAVIVTMIRNRREERTAEEVLHTSMVVKLVQIPAYCITFCLGVYLAATLLFLLLNVYLIVYDLLSIFLTGLLGANGVSQACREEKLSRGKAVLLGLLQFVFCWDVIVAMYLYWKVRRMNREEV